MRVYHPTPTRRPVAPRWCSGGHANGSLSSTLHTKSEAVSWPTKELPQALTDSVSLREVSPHGDPFVEEERERVQATERMDQAIPDRSPRLLTHEGAEEPVPDDEDSAVVAVQVLLVRCVMHPVVRW